MGRIYRHWWLLMALLIAPFPYVQADSLYRWTDSEGNLHYGDRPPAGEAAQAEQLSMPSFAQPARSAEEDPYSILNQVERLETSRQNLMRERREKRREEREYDLRRRELEARKQALQPPENRRAYGYGGIWRPVIPRPPIHGPGWPGHHPRSPGLWQPDHPAFRPPMHPRPPIAVPYPARGGAVIVAPR